MPAKTQYVGKLREDLEVHDVFLVLQKQVAAGKTGRNYLRLTLGDTTGQIEGRVWEGADEIAQRFESGDLVYVTGGVTSFQGVLQVKVSYVEKLDEEDAARADWSHFLPASERDAGEMLEELKELLDTLENPFLRRLVSAFLDDPEFLPLFVRAPAAKGMHHAYVAGLLEHTLGVVKLADRVAPLYPVNRDLLLTGAFLHDVGKTEELTASAGFDYTDAGRLLGHIVLGAQMARTRAAAIEKFPEGLLLHVEHLILSHHGELEWGSPKRPKTVEALLLHAIDNMDAKTMAALEAIRKNDGPSGDWTGFLRIFDRPFYRSPLNGPAFGERAEPRSGSEAVAPAKRAAKSPKPPQVPGTDDPAAPKKPGSDQGDLGF